VNTTWRRGLLLVVSLGAAIRLISLAEKWNRELLLNDSIWYSYTATDLTKGVWFRNILSGGPSAEHPPLTTLFITPLSFLSDPVVGQRITTAMLGIVSVAVIALVGRRIGGERVGLAAGVLAAVYPNVWLSDGLVMSESLAILLVATFLLAALELVPRPQVPLAIAVGALTALAALTRSELLLLIPLTVAVLWHGHGLRAVWRPVTALCLTAAVVLLPWFAYNVSRFERTVLLTTNDGTTLYGANCDDVYSGWNMGAWSVFCVLDAAPIAGDDSVRSAEQRRLAIEYVGDHIERVPLVVTARVARTLDLFGVRDMVNGDVGEERPRAGVWAGVFMFWVLAPLAALGFRRIHGTDRLVLLMPIITVAVTAVLFYGSHRLRSPAEPVLCVAAAMFLVGWSADRRGDHAGHTLGTGGGEPTVVEPDDHQIVG
jgi:Dolichyl-phosphate-mannose-protein mannosyltransferase